MTTTPNTPAGGAVAWQFRFVMSDVGYWSGWAQAQSEDDARHMVECYAALGQQAEWRALYTQPPATVSVEAVLALVGKWRGRRRSYKPHIQARNEAFAEAADELESLTRGEK